MAKLTRQQRLAHLLDEVQKLIPAPANQKYAVEYNPTYGGYRLIAVDIKSGAHYGCFGGNGCEARIKFDAMLVKLNTIISTAEAIRYQTQKEWVIK